MTESQELRAKAAEWRARARSIDDRRLQYELVRLASLFEEAARRIDTHDEASLSPVYTGVGER